MAAADKEPTEATTAETRPSDDTPIGTAGVPTTPVREYLQFSGVATGEVPPPMGRDHAYTAEGIRKLDAALAASSSRSTIRMRERRCGNDTSSSRRKPWQSESASGN